MDEEDSHVGVKQAGKRVVAIDLLSANLPSVVTATLARGSTFLVTIARKRHGTSVENMIRNC